MLLIVLEDLIFTKEPGGKMVNFCLLADILSLCEDETPDPMFFFRWVNIQNVYMVGKYFLLVQTPKEGYLSPLLSLLKYDHKIPPTSNSSVDNNNKKWPSSLAVFLYSPIWRTVQLRNRNEKNKNKQWP